jgi:Zn-dependent protease
MSDRKIYYSFSEVPLKNQQYNDNSHSSKISFSKTEIIHIIISMLVLTIAFAFAFSPYPPLSHIANVIYNLPIAFLGIATAFFCHELAHKYMGQKYGYWSEFRMYTNGLLLALFFAIFTGFVFAAPGAVQIFGYPDREKMGKISIAGPLTNITIGILFLVIFIISTSDTIKFISGFISTINFILGIFNLIPLGPLDGLKIFHWRKDIWAITFFITTALFLFKNYFNVIFTQIL